MSPSTSAANVSAFRQRLRDKGFVKKDVWIRPEFSSLLSEMEKAMRNPEGPTLLVPARPWSVADLRAALQSTVWAKNGRITLSDAADGEALRVIMHDYGDVGVVITVSHPQIVAEVLLWPYEDIADPAAFNEFVLQTHKYLPLSTISMSQVGKQTMYTMFGSLDSQSPLSSIVLEMETLAENAVMSSYLYQHFFNKEA